MRTNQKRYNKETKEYEENKKINDFFADIFKIINKHKLTISHEDVHGSFVVKPANVNDVTWLLDAQFDLNDHSKVKIKTPEKEVKPQGRIKYKFYKPDKDNGTD